MNKPPRSDFHSQHHGQSLEKKHRPKLTIAILLAAGCLSSMTGGVVAPILPEVVEQLQIERWGGLLMGLPRLTVALSSPLLGLLADRMGKLRVLVPSLLAFALFGMAGAIVPNFSGLLFTRALVGVANGGISAASIGFVARSYEGETRTRLMGYVASVLAIAGIVFPLLGGWVGSFRWEYAFCLYGLALPVAAAAIWGLQEPTTATATAVDLQQAQSLRHSLQDIRVISLLLTLAVSSGVFYTVVVYAPLYFKEAIDADSMLNGTILAARALGAAIISAIGASRLAKRLGSATTIALGFVFMSVTLGTIPYLNLPQLALIAAFGFGIGFGLVMPNLYDLLAELCPPERRSTLLALGTGISSLGQFFSPIVLGPIWEVAGEAVFSIAAGVAIALAVLQFRSFLKA